MSPYADLTLSGETLSTKQAVDPILTPDGLRLRVPGYVTGADASDPYISPVFGDLRGLPPLLIQVGSHEILLSDAVRLAGRAATADVRVTLEVIPGVPHVFQGFAAALDEGDAALDRAAVFLKEQLAATQPTRMMCGSDPHLRDPRAHAQNHDPERPGDQSGRRRRSEVSRPAADFTALHRVWERRVTSRVT